MLTWRQRLAAVLEWSVVDKSIILMVILLSVLSTYMLALVYVLARSDRERLVDVPITEQLLALESGMALGALLIIAAGLWLRRRLPDFLPLQHLATQYYTLTLVFCSYFVGTMTFCTGVVLLGAPVFGFILLNRRVVWYATASGTVSLLALSYAAGFGFIPYAPMVVPPTDATGNLFWINAVFLFTAPHFIVIILFADLTLNWWRKREDYVRTLSLTDPLTGIPNRRSILDMLDKEVARTTRHGPPLSVLLLDLDHFKRINDTWGHPAGDRVLQETAKVLRNAIRQCDAVGRYGGEEFMLVLPDTRLDGAVKLAERCRVQLAATVVTADNGEPIPLSGSFGLVSNELDLGVDAEALIKAADNALYRAKANGRNRVEALALQARPTT
ncbi:MAG: GGDEF domain-containing protein [Fluviicoccus sp.]|uniref:GGDEF domain-containing protein n=1 Tax=Fluviicoccus sp. TaxID=2003552 RepID=UPI002720B987|nr:GGDEF domain-containing protein [Fluviicoccus sp.]MDO8332059.1 GGDEF domain-containing protein [Fluviicoccus sp.]